MKMYIYHFGYSMGNSRHNHIVIIAENREQADGLFNRNWPETLSEQQREQLRKSKISVTEHEIESGVVVKLKPGSCS